MANPSAINPAVLHSVADSDPHQEAHVTVKFRVTHEQAEAFKALPVDLQHRLGPPVFGAVLNAHELKGLAARARMNETASTIMCPW